MNDSKKTLLLLVVLMGSFIFIEAPSVMSQSTSHLAVVETGQSLIAGFNNTVTVTVVNNYLGYIAIYDVGIEISLPSGLNLVGTGGTWHYDSIPYGQGVTISFQVYAPSADAGTSYSGTLTVTYKQLGDISYTSESHSLTFAVTGYINLVVYGVQVTPSQISPGGNTTISGNILNNGNLASYNANVTVESDELSPAQPSSVFLGEVDPNIPRPFSVLVVFKPGIQPGNYTVTISVSATDNNRPTLPIVGQGSSVIQVTRPTQTSFAGRGQGRGGIVAQILAFLRSLFNAFFGASYP